jgi:uncharacterized protein with von Willebrand factor type A (vWA) domain
MAKICGGYILLARKILESDVMDKPPLYLKLWIWMLEQANHKDGYRGLKRGQFFTSIDKMIDAMTHYIGARKIVPTARQVRTCLDWMRIKPLKSTKDRRKSFESPMIVTTKVTHGLMITINNYNEYQNPNNYESHAESNSKVIRKSLRSHNSKQEGNKKEQELKIEYPSWLKIKSWNEYKQYRKEIKKPMTNLAEKKALKKLGLLINEGYDQEEIIDQTIASGWTGLFETKVKQRPKAKNLKTVTAKNREQFLD